MRVISMKSQLRETDQYRIINFQYGHHEFTIGVLKSTVCGGCAGGSVGTVVGHGEGSVVKDIVLAYRNEWRS